jgi:hypothetical protein
VISPVPALRDEQYQEWKRDEPHDDEARARVDAPLAEATLSVQARTSLLRRLSLRAAPP